MYLGNDDINKFLKSKDWLLCQDGKIDQATVYLAQQADLVIFVTSWKEWAAMRLPETLEKFSFSPDQKVLVIGSKGFKPVTSQFILNLKEKDLPETRIPARAERIKTNSLMRSLLSNTIFVDVYDLLCDSGYKCPLFTPEGELISHDGSHLTEAGAGFLGIILFDNPLLRLYRFEEK